MMLPEEHDKALGTDSKEKKVDEMPDQELKELQENINRQTALQNQEINAWHDMIKTFSKDTQTLEKN